MNAVVFEHVKVAELPEGWRRRLAIPADAHVTVRIEAEADASAVQTPASFNDDPLFGMWRDREDMADVAAYIRRIRASRFNPDGSQS